MVFRYYCKPRKIDARFHSVPFGSIVRDFTVGAIIDGQSRREIEERDREISRSEESENGARVARFFPARGPSLRSFMSRESTGKKAKRGVEYFTRNRAPFAVKGIIKRHVVKENSTLSVPWNDTPESRGITKSSRKRPSTKFPPALFDHVCRF